MKFQISIKNELVAEFVQKEEELFELELITKNEWKSFDLRLGLCQLTNMETGYSLIAEEQTSVIISQKHLKEALAFLPESFSFKEVP